MPDGMLATELDTEPADLTREQFRTIMSSLVSGVTVVSSIDPTGVPCGFTCSAVCTASHEPPILLCSVRSDSGTLDAITTGGRFTVNFLDVDGTDLANVFASRAEDKFASVQWRPSRVTGMPLLGTASAYADCQLHGLVEAGDHHVVLGRVVDGAARDDRFPLGYWRRDYVRVFRMVGRRRRPR